MHESSNDHRDLAGISRRSEDVEAYYDAWAAAYDADIRAWGYAAPERVARCLRAVLPPPATVLDVGCGTGLSGEALAAQGYGSVDGVDVSARSLARAAETGAYRRTLQGDFQHVPTALRTDGYDGLVCVGVMTYLPDTAAVLDEFLRVVRPDGWVVYTQRTDLFEERGCAALLAELEAGGAIQELELSEPVPYLPGHESFGDAIRIRLVRFRVAGTPSRGAP